MRTHLARMEWTPPDDWIRVRTIDAHAEGEPLRVIVDGFPIPEGASVLARRRAAAARLDGLRRALMWEPRGHADMYGCLLMPAVTPGADLSVLFLHNAGFSTMCGHGIVAVTTVLLETGLHPSREPRTELAIDTPAGLVRAAARVDTGRVREVRFRNVPSFALALDRRVTVPGLGGITCDVAFGGAFYAFVAAADAGLELTPHNAPRIIDVGRRIRAAVSDAIDITHPDDPDLGFLYGTIFTGSASAAGRHSRHACVFAEGELDRSPTGTGVSARLAILEARGEGTDGWIEIESVIGSRFRGRVAGRSTVGARPAIVPEIAGRAFLTGRHEFWIDPADPWREGFLVR